MIDQACIQEIKDTANVVEVVGKFVNLKPQGVNVVGLCPFHNEKSPSFKVSKTKNIYKCFGCGESGDSIEFLMKSQSMSYLDAIRYLADMYKITIVEENAQPKKTYTKPVFRDGQLSGKYLNWFSERGITPNTLQQFKVTQAMEWMPKAGATVETICFNYFVNDTLVNIKYRAENKDFKLSKDAELVFYNADSMKGRDYVVITEGEIDCLSVYQSGAKSVISVPNGAAKGVQKLDYLNNCWDMFSDKTNIILMVDNDGPGINLRDELARRFGYDRCFKVEYPSDCKDANDVLVKHGPLKIAEMIKNASEFPIEGVFSMSEMVEDVRAYYNTGYPVGIKVGIPVFDDHLSFMLGQFTTITGIPGSGKSEFVDYLMSESAKNHNWSWGVCSFENQPSSLHVTKIMEKYAGKAFSKQFNDEDRISPEMFDRAINFVDAHFYFININKVDVTLEGILEKTKELVLRKGIKGLLIDPWNYIEHKGAKGQTETQYVSECLTKIKAFALTHGIHIFLVAHPLKMPKTGGKYEVPTLYNISGSAHFFNKTDNGLTVYRDLDTKIVDVHIQKVRYSWLGKIGVASFLYNLTTRQYEPLHRQKDPPAQEVPDKANAGIIQQPTRPPASFWNEPT